VRYDDTDPNNKKIAIYINSQYHGCYKPEDDMFKVISAHELFHTSTRLVYDVDKDSWFYEALSVWMEDEVYPDVNDYFKYLISKHECLRSTTNGKTVEEWAKDMCDDENSKNPLIVEGQECFAYQGWKCESSGNKIKCWAHGITKTGYSCPKGDTIKCTVSKPCQNVGFFGTPDYSLTSKEGDHHYGAAVFVKYLSEHYGGQETINETLKNIKGGDDVITAIDKALNDQGTNFKEAFANFGVANYIHCDGIGLYCYNDGSDYPDISYGKGHLCDLWSYFKDELQPGKVNEEVKRVFKLHCSSTLSDNAVISEIDGKTWRISDGENEKLYVIEETDKPIYPLRVYSETGQSAHTLFTESGEGSDNFKIIGYATDYIKILDNESTPSMSIEFDPERDNDYIVHVLQDKEHGVKIYPDGPNPYTLSGICEETIIIVSRTSGEGGEYELTASEPYKPTIEITNPKEPGEKSKGNNIITGDTTITVEASTDYSKDIAEIEIYIDGEFKDDKTCSLDSCIFNYLWSPTPDELNNKRHLITAVAIDEDGNTAKDGVTVITTTESNPSYSTYPFVHEIHPPTDGSVVSGRTYFCARADGSLTAPIQKMEWSVDDSFFAEIDWSNPYLWIAQCSILDASDLDDGDHVLSVRAENTNNKWEANTITVTVLDPLPKMKSNIELGETVNGVFPLRIAFACGCKVPYYCHCTISYIKVYVHSTRTYIGSAASTTGKFKLRWDTTTLPDGMHTLEIQAYDKNDNLVTTDYISVFVYNPSIDSIEITSPAANSTHQNNITINATATGTVKEIKIKIDNTQICEHESDSISCSFNTQNLLNGEHTITATAYTPSYTSNSTSITVTVNNTETPTINLTNPVNASNVSGIVELSAAVYDVEGNLINNFNDIEYYVDGNARYRYWNTAVYPDGSSHTIYAMAYDGMGNNITSGTVNVTVVDLPPEVAFLNLTSGSNVTDIMIIKADISDDRGIKDVNLTINGTEYEYPYLWDEFNN